MNVEDVLSDFRGKDRYGYDYEGVTLVPLLELHSYEMVGGGWNAAPDGSVFVKFAQKWPFTKFSGYSDDRCFCPEEVFGVVPEDFDREQLLQFVSDAIKTFCYANEKEINSDGSFRFWFD
jgi:hypothetical protein